MKKKITCIVCPRGCTMNAEVTPDGIAVTGNSCSRGKEHAIRECTHPVRSLSSVIRVSNREGVMVSVKTAMPIPKERMQDVMEHIRHVEAMAPIAVGQVIISDLYGTDIVATKDVR